MPHKIKNYFALLLLIITFPVFSQINTYSPYSRFGLGELATPGFAQNSGLGSSSIALRNSTHVNYLNPASYSGLDTLSFVFDFGLSAGLTKYSDGVNNKELKTANIHHIAIGFPIASWWKAAAGIVPYSNVGYNIGQNDFLSGYGPVEYLYEGSGGLNKLFFGSSLELFKKLSIGANFSYMFGFLEYKNRTNFPSDNNAATTIFNNRLDITKTMFNFGIQYHEVINKKYFYTLGITFDNKTSLNANKTEIVQQFFPGRATQVGIGKDSLPIYIPVALEFDRSDKKGKITYPQNLGIGVSLGLTTKLLITGEYNTQKWSDSKFFGRTDSLLNSSAYRGGIEFLPNKNALKGYFNHTTFRLGGYYSNSYLHLHGEQLKDYGITFGVGLPFRNSKSAVNLSVILGKRGNLENSLVEEKYGMIHLGITLQDFWFHTRKID